MLCPFLWLRDVTISKAVLYELFCSDASIVTNALLS